MTSAAGSWASTATMDDMTEPSSVPMDPIEALALEMFEDDMAPLLWSQANEQQKRRWSDLAAQEFVERELRARQ